ncbi:MAG: DUF1425 domain-containing protein [Propionivibrio sp.]|nr:DUF1425 domain-containing protein [Propionivibrio sp.]
MAAEPTQVAMGSAPPPAAAAPSASSGPSMASKIEEQGKMNNLKVTDMRATKRDNLLRIQVDVTNISSSNQQLYYRFKWLDRDGFTVWDEEPWKPMIVYGNQKQVINVVSPTFKATDFRLICKVRITAATSPHNHGKHHESSFGPFGRFTLVAASVLALTPMLASGGSASQTSRPVSHGYAALTQDGSGDIAISDLRATMQDRLLRVQADLRNPTTSDRQLYYRFEWLDQDGLAVWDDEPWKPMIVSARANGQSVFLLHHSRQHASDWLYRTRTDIFRSRKRPEGIDQQLYQEDPRCTRSQILIARQHCLSAP